MKAYGEHFSSERFFDKLKTLSGGSFCGLIKKAITLYALLKSDQVSASVKLLIVAALGYFICPVDAIPDFIPVAGYSDDLSVMTLLLAQLDSLVTADIEAEVESMLPEACS